MYDGLEEKALEVIQALDGCRRQPADCGECNYNKFYLDCERTLMSDAADLLRATYNLEGRRP